MWISCNTSADQHFQLEFSRESGALDLPVEVVLGDGTFPDLQESQNIAQTITGWENMASNLLETIAPFGEMSVFTSSLGQNGLSLLRFTLFGTLISNL